MITAAAADPPSLINTGLYKYLLVEAAIHMIINPPGVMWSF